MLNYLIFDYKIELNEDIRLFVLDYPLVHDLFLKRELHNSLVETLPVKAVNQEIIKI